jgi:hypothetical protein
MSNMYNVVGNVCYGELQHWNRWVDSSSNETYHVTNSLFWSNFICNRPRGVEKMNGIIKLYAEHRGHAVCNSSYSGGPGFKSEPGDRVYWFFFVISSVPPGNLCYSTSNWATSTVSPIRFSLIIRTWKEKRNRSQNYTIFYVVRTMDIGF